MKNYLRFILMGLPILVVSLVYRIYQNYDRIENDNTAAFSYANHPSTKYSKGSDGGNDTIYVLGDLKLEIQLNKKWQKVRVDSEKAYSFTLDCLDSIFCPSFTIHSVTPPLLTLEPEALKSVFLEQIQSEYDSSNIVNHYIFEGNKLKFQCFDFVLYNQGHHFGSSICLTYMDLPVLITHLAINEPRGSYKYYKKDYLEILNLIKVTK